MPRACALLVLAIVALGAACDRPDPADLLLLNARVYTLGWGDPDPEGRPSTTAPHDAHGWRPDATAVAVRGDRIIFVGRTADAERYRGPQTDVRDLAGATVIPGLIDTHVHLAELGAALDRVNLVGLETEAQVVAKVVERAARVPAGQWIEGWGWDEGAWAGRYPDMRLLSQRVPNHPVLLRGLHGFAVWGNRLAFQRARITAKTPAPLGGEIIKDARGAPTGVLLNNATALLRDAVPPVADAALDTRLTAALEALAAAGYVAVEEAGADSALLAALERLRDRHALPLRVSAMLAAGDAGQLDRWLARGPEADHGQMLVVRGVKAFYDGAMGSRGAFFLSDYSDRPGHHGVGGPEYGFDRERMAAMMRAGFQIAIHAIGDRANREALDLIEAVLRADPDRRDTRPRIEHAQVVSPTDLARFGELGVIASMQPAHAVEDMPWAEARIGPERITGAYAWRSLRRAGARLVFNSDLPATDHSIFYGLHSAITRQDRQGRPEGGAQPAERLRAEEALRGWTVWAAWAMHRDQVTGTIATGRWADLTVMDLDPLQLGDTRPAGLFDGKVLLTVVGGRVVYARP